MRMGQNGTMKGRRVIREEVIAEYLRGEYGYRELGLRYGIGKSTLQRWVKAAGGGERGEKVPEAGKKVEAARTAGPRETSTEASPEVVELSESEAGAEIKRLRRELYKKQLHTELLNAMIDIAKDELGIDLRKKHGLKR